MSTKVLITDDVHPLLIELLQQQGYTAVYEPVISREAILETLHQYVGLIINSRTRANREMIDAGPQLKFIGRLGSGMEIIDVPYAESKDIACISAPEGNRNAVAEHALGMLLALMNNLARADREVRSGLWRREENRGIELDGRTVGIYGYGHTGSAFAKKLRGFEVEVLAYDKYKTGFGDEWVTESSPDEIFRKADVLSLHLPFTEETHYLVNESFLQNFDKQLIIINTSRGKVIKTSDLLAAIDEGRVRSAGLDVLENERMNTLTTAEKALMQELSKLDNILLSPHIAGWSVESKKRIASVLATKIDKIMSL